MNPRPAAALALIGWYLMAPPMHNGAPNYDAPLRSWNMSKAYDSARDCEADREAAKQACAQVPDVEKPFTGCADTFDRSRCIASDDPRLKEK
jgi:hypothetical protein